ncbi:ParA family protein [Crenobacter cavernae]|uniref:ParA family protein n=1 Tax=Crenobacter cavernae TaxID=2290923 RepID=A0A345Y5L0_9NEIS|nr:AAA family ATPase [Crenobacter cavernae]AXK39212.1 ParA family protein [Crenobacter cavernae]
MSARVMAVANQKGGVGKTTTVVNLAAGLAELGRRVLIIDLDPQANATMGCGIDKHALERSVYHVLIDECETRDAITRSETGGFDVLPANRDLAGADVELVEMMARETRLKVSLADVEGDYDYIFIDCPPALNMMTINGFVAADSVIIPMQCEYFALEGLAELSTTLRKIKKWLNPKIEIEGVLRTLFEPQRLLSVQVSEQLKKHYGDKVYDTVIPRNVRLAEAPSYGRPIFAYDRSSRGAKAYAALAAELVSRLEPAAQPQTDNV